MKFAEATAAGVFPGIAVVDSPDLPPAAADRSGPCFPAKGDDLTVTSAASPRPDVTRQ